MIPQEKIAAITRGLSEAFGVTALEEIRAITQRPASNLAYRIIVRGSAFLLRINTRAGDTARHYACMKAAAEAGLAPRVWYTNAEDRISITDFVNASPFPVAEALVRIPAALRTLHALPPFPEVPNRINTTCTFLINKGDAVDAFLHRFRAAEILPKAESDELLARYAQIAAVYPHHALDMASSHNDLFKPDNMIFDGQHLWLVDWEAAFLNDRYADLAVAANLVVSNDAEERAFLQEYFGRPPDHYQLARLHLARQLAHTFYAMGFLLIGSGGKPIDWSGPVPSFRDFHRRFWAGEIELSDNATKITYGRVHTEQLFENVYQERYAEALEIVAEGRAHASLVS